MRITGKTKIMFILADPVDHVVGSDMLNRRFEEDGLDVAVSPLHIPPPALAQALSALRTVANVIGFGVTIPHKIAVMPLLDRLTARAQLAGAVNIVRRHANGELEGDNVDGAGFVAGLREHGVEPAGKRILQLGAGGAGAAIAAALADAGAAAVHIHNRTPARAEALAAAVAAQRTGIDVQAVPHARPDGYDIVVNTTAAGMGASGTLPLDPAGLTAAMTVAEIIMAPAITPLLAAAQMAQCKTVPGQAMLAPQYMLMRNFLGI